MSRFAKAMVYALLTAVLIALWWWLTGGFTLEAAGAGLFSRALLAFAAMGVAVLGVGIFLRRGNDAIFFIAVGGAALAAGILMLLFFGGLENTLAPGADVAMNLLACGYALLTAAFWVRTAVLCASTRDDSRVKRRLAGCAALLLAVWMVVLIVAGQTMRFVHIPKAEEEPRTADIAWIGDE